MASTMKNTVLDTTTDAPATHITASPVDSLINGEKKTLQRGSKRTTEEAALEAKESTASEDAMPPPPAKRQRKPTPAAQEAAAQKLVRQTRKRKVTTPVPENTTNDAVTDEEASAPLAKKQKTAKSAAKETAAPKKAKAAPKAKAKLTAKATRKAKAEPEKEATPPLPQPAPVTPEVAAKIKQVKTFLAGERPSLLEHDAENDKIVTVSHWTAHGALMHMRNHWQMGSSDDANVTDLDEAIIDVIQRPIGTSTEPVDWLVIDTSKKTAFEAEIKEKLARHGLEHVSLLMVELEIITDYNLARAGLYDRGPIVRQADAFLDAVEKVFAYREDDEAEMMPASDEQEVGRVGVCVAPIRDE